jgi:hypothetical protein
MIKLHRITNVHDDLHTAQQLAHSTTARHPVIDHTCGHMEHTPTISTRRAIILTTEKVEVVDGSLKKLVLHQLNLGSVLGSYM